MSISLKELQKTELQILIDFDKFCKEKGLQYYLIGGALLGAVRYQKFIPWDDDIDVAMPRADYERIKEIFSIDGCFLQNNQSDPRFSRCIQKIRRNGTRIAEKTCAHIDMHQGIYIDIFPIDYVADNCSKKIAKRAGRIRRLMSLRAIKGGYKSDRHIGLKKIIQWFLPVSIKHIDRKIDELCTKDNHLDQNYSILWLHNYSWEKQIHDCVVFGEGSKCSFEGYDFIAPANVDAFLIRVFGEEYMKEPEPEKRKCPHNYMNVNPLF